MVFDFIMSPNTLSDLTNFSHTIRPGGEQGRGPLMGKIIGVSGLSQFWGADFKNRWHTGVGWGFQPHFHDLRSHSGEGKRHAILKQKAGEDFGD